MFRRHLFRAFFLISLAGVFYISSVSPTRAATYYCFTGSYTTGSETQKLLFTLDSALGPGDPLSFKTWHYNGGTNWAGATIAGGNFDPILGLYDSGNNLVAVNDDSPSPPPFPYDSYITRSAIPSSLAAGDYYLELFACYGNLGGRNPNWAVDIQGPDTGMYMTGASLTPGSTLGSLWLGSDMSSPQPYTAVLNVAAGQSMTFTGEINVGLIGEGEINLNGVMQGKYMNIGGGGGQYGDQLGLGAVTVTGNTAHLTLSNGLIVGYGAPAPGMQFNGHLIILNGGLVDSIGYTLIGGAANSSGSLYVDGTANGARSHFNSSQIISVGYEGDGLIRIFNGGLVTSPGGSIAPYSGDGSVELQGTDSSGNPAEWDLSGDLNVGGSPSPYNCQGILNVYDGGKVNVDSTHGINILNHGVVNLYGGLISTGSLTVNSGGAFNHTDGELDINGGAFNPGASDYTIDGAGASDSPLISFINGAKCTLTGQLNVAQNHTASISIMSGSLVTSSLAAIGGSAPGAQGSVTVDGAGSIWTVNGDGSSSDGVTMWIGGPHSSGSLIIQNQGKVELTGPFTGAIVGNTADSTGEIDISGAGSRFDSQNDMIVGYSGHGILRISDGGLMSSCGGDIAVYSGSTGSSVTLEGTGPGPAYSPAEWDSYYGIFVGGSWWTGSGDSGRLTVKQGGLVQIPTGPPSNWTTLKIWPQGTVELLGGQITTGSFINAGGTFTHTDGALEVDGGTFDPGVTNYVLDGGAPGNLPWVRLSNAARANISGNITVGNANNASMRIYSGSQVTCGGDAYIGRLVTSTQGSEISVMDANSKLILNGGNLYVGYYGWGGMDIWDNGSVVNQDAWVGMYPTSKGSYVNLGNYNGPPASWTVNGNLYIGDVTGSGLAYSAQVAVCPHGVLSVGGAIVLHQSGTLWTDSVATIQSPAIMLLGGKLSGRGWIASTPGYNNDLTSWGGTVDAPYPLDSLDLSGNVTLSENTTLQKTGSGTLILEGGQFWYDYSAFAATEGVTQYSCTRSSAVAGPASLQISHGATVQVISAFDPLTDAADPQKHVAVLNDGSFEIDGGTPIGVSSITGNGNTTLESNAHLEVDSIEQNFLTISSGSVLTIRAIPGGPTAGPGFAPLSAQSVPEPSGMVLAGLAFLSWFFSGNRPKRMARHIFHRSGDDFLSDMTNTFV